MSRREPRFRLTSPVVPEDELQHAVFMALRVLLPGDAIINTWELRNAASAAEGARRKRLGARAGWPDMGVLFDGVWVLLELKREDGVLSPPQRALHEQFARNKCPVAVCRSVDDALDACAAAGIPLRGRLGA